VFDGSSLGIGTTAPTSTLDVRGNISLDRGRYIYFGLQGSTGEYIYESPTGTIRIHAASSDALVIPNNDSFIYTPLSLGIGTTSPTYRLQIGNAGSLADSIRIGSYAVANNTRQYIGYARADTGLFESAGNGDSPSTVLAGVVGIRIVNTVGTVAPSQADNSIQLLTHIYNGNSRVALHAQYDGNIGIGTTSPSALLSVGAGTGNPNSTQFRAVIRGTGGRTLYLDSDSGGASMWWGNGSTPQFAIDSTSGGGAAFWTHTSGTWSSRVTIASDGNVGINSTAPGYKLDITGDFRSTGGIINGILVINRNTTGLRLNRDAVTNYNGIYYSTANSDKWFIGMRENLLQKVVDLDFKQVMEVVLQEEQLLLILEGIEHYFILMLV
jgi:hypothetical protein